MADFVLPPWFRVTECEWKIIGNTASFTSPFSGATRVYERPGDRWAARLVVRNLKDETTNAKRTTYTNLIAQLRNRANKLFYTPAEYKKRGAFQAPELFVNHDFRNGTLGWNAVLGLIKVIDQQLYIADPSGASGPSVNQSVSVPNGGRAAVTSLIEIGQLSLPVPVFGRFIQTQGQYSTTPGYGSFSQPVGVSPDTVRPLDAAAFSGFGGWGFDFLKLSYASCSYALRLNNVGNFTPSRMLMNGFPPNTQNLLLPGDWISIHGTQGPELKQVTAVVDSEGGGSAWVNFTPPMRGPFSNTNHVIVNKPMGRFMLAEDEVGWSSRPGVISEFELNLVEV
jgi:hypothetical protein